MGDENLQTNADFLFDAGGPSFATDQLPAAAPLGPISFNSGGSQGFSFTATSGGANVFTATVGVANAVTARGAMGAAAKASPAITATTIPLAKITGGGVDGSITVNAEGIVTAYVAPT